MPIRELCAAPLNVEATYRPRLLMVAFSFDPQGTMEERNGWQRAIVAAKNFDVTVLYCPTVEKTRLVEQVPSALHDHVIKLIPISHNWIGRRLASCELSFYAGYRHWQQLAFLEARRLHGLTPFDMSHIVTLCGFREPGNFWQLEMRTVWGPLGGTHHFPSKFFKTINTWNRFRETCRTFLNHYQLNWSPSIRRAAHRSSIVIAATQSAKESLERGLGVPVELDLETGLDYPISEIRNARDTTRPLRILWTGRLRAWKGLPLLLHAIAQLPKETRVQLRVVGTGSSQGEWKQLSVKLGVANCIEWIPWPNYRETMPLYEWADVFAFTSLRDTSGTGLLEALAAGCPIIGLNHQGAADIMTQACSIPISITNVQLAVGGFTQAITKLSSDANHWLQLSHGATQRAKHFHWDQRHEWMLGIYARVLENSQLSRK